MRRARLISAVLAACAGWLATTAAPALAVPPVNDNYLSSLQMTQGGGVARTFTDSVDTTEATTQADLFNPNRDGFEFGGGGPEQTRCGGVTYGQTVWYDFAPETFGGVQILAAGYDAVVRVYEFDPLTSRITRTVRCQNDSPGAAEDVILPRVSRATAYTVQVGRVATPPPVPPAAPLPIRLDFRFDFFPDQDRDDVLDDAPDRCPTRPGILAAGGCPPTVGANPRIAFDRRTDGVQITRLEVDGLPRGARVEARCKRCKLKQAKVAERRAVTLPKFEGAILLTGSKLELFVTRAATDSGRFRHGAIGTYYAFDVKAGSLGRRTIRCLLPGSLVPRKKCV